MKTILMSLFLIILSTNIFGQINYKQGYFIGNDNEETKCYIKNIDWKNNPKRFTYRLSDKGESETIDLSKVKEFCIFGSLKFIRANVEIDRSSDDINMLSSERKPNWYKERLFLKVLIEGKASLFLYKEGNFERFFYSVDDSSINQLIHKKYLIVGKGLKYNDRYKQQLLNEVSCSRAKMTSINNISYQQRDLVKYFTKYNQCVGGSSAGYVNDVKREKFNLKITPGLDYTSLTISNLSNDFAFDNKASFRIGIETEYILPFNKNKWSLMFEPTYQYLNLENEIMKINFSSIDFQIGLRHYFFLNEKLKLFVNCFYNSNFALIFNPTIENFYNQNLSIKTRHNYAFGIGLNYNRLSVELRYYTNRDLFSDYPLWFSDYNKMSIIMGYTILQRKKGGSKVRK